MKKILWIIIALLVAMTSFACGAVPQTIDMFKPWQGTYEKAVYDVSFYYFLKTDQSNNANLSDKIVKDPLENNAPKIKFASGILEYIIEQVDEEKNTWQLTSNLTVNYLKDEDLSKDILGAEYKDFVSAINYVGIKNLGVQDTMNSTVVFSMQTGKLFRPISVTKKYSDLSKAESLDKPYILEYSFDYNTRKYTYNLNGEEKAKTFKAKEVKSGYDNEELYLFARALDKKTYGKGATLSVSPFYNWTDSIGSKTAAAYTINMSIDDEIKTISVTDAFLPYVQELVNTDNRLPVYDVTLAKASTYESGPSLKAYYSQYGINANNSYADKLMIKAVQNIMDVSQVRRTLAVSYDIASLEIR
ncbi:MAG TPA: hypothetical protein VIL26_01765 [Clostridia bacterium]